MFKLLKNEFDYCKDINWKDVIDKIDYECRNRSTCKIMYNNFTAPTFILENDSYLPRSILKVSNKVHEKMQTKKCHVYTSLGEDSPTFGRHCDPVNVLLVQSIGSISYMIDDNYNSEIVNLNPGDGIIIKKGIFHAPIIKESRVTLSFSWD